MNNNDYLPTTLPTKAHHGTLRRQNQNKRSNRIIMTTEARALKQIREDRKAKVDKKLFSLRAVAKKVGRTDAWLAHIENGRADVPTDGRLDALLNIYGLKRKSFYERVRTFKEKITPKLELQFLTEQITDEQAQLILSFTKTIMQQQ